MEIVMIFIFLCVLLVLFIIKIYNRLVRLKNLVKNAYSQIDVQLKRRYDLIPNLVETAKGYLKHEKETLENVILARNAAAQAAETLRQNPQNSQAFKNLLGAEQGLTQGISKIMMLAENYPELKANESMKAVMEELTSTENRVSFSRQAYNDAVLEFNTKIESFPDSLIADNFGFKAYESFIIQKEEEKEAPKVKF